MRPSARLQAAITIVDDIQKHHRPAATALTDWGRSHRFAGSGDRSAIGTLVYDALRARGSSSYFMGSSDGRTLVLGGLREQGIPLSDIAAMCDGTPHSPVPLTPEESRCRACSDPASWPRPEQWPSAHRSMFASTP